MPFQVPLRADLQRTPLELAIFPIGMPLIAGPGSIVATVLLTENARFDLIEQAETGAVVVTVMVITYSLLRLSEPIARLLGTVGTSVISRIMGLVLTALAVQYFINGVALTLRAHSA